jgi:transketolase
MRNQIIEGAYEIMKENKNSYFLTGDLGFNTLEKIESDFGNRFINIGIAEQNMIGIAAGLAKSGKKVFCYSIIPFLVMRSFEQIRNDISHHDLDVTLLGAGSGLSYGILSNTHFAVEDIAILRTLPNMTIFSPIDGLEAKLGMDALKKYHHPTYIRIGTRNEPIVYNKPFNFVLGKGNIIRKGKDMVVFVTGNIAEEVIKATEIIESTTKLTTTIVDIHTIKPIDKEIILREIKNKKIAFCVEEHGTIGGLGDAVMSIIGESKTRIKVVKIGLDNQYSKTVGNRDYLRKMYNLDRNGIARTFKKALNL